MLNEQRVATGIAGAAGSSAYAPEITGVDESKTWNTVLTPLKLLERSSSYLKDKTAVVYRTERYNYSKFYENCCRMASALKAAGLQKGQKVAFLSRNRPELLEAHFGVPLAGGILVALNTRLAPKEIAYILTHSESKFLFVDAPFATIFEKMTKSGDNQQVGGERMTIVTLTDGEFPQGISTGVLPYEEFLAQGRSSRVEVSVESDYDLISINYTSGTTGSPKGAMYHHKGAYLNALGEALEHNLNSDSVYLWTLPMFHCNGWCFTWSVASVGGVNVCLDRLDAGLVYSLIERERVTHMCGAPTVYVTLLEHMRRNGLKFPNRVHMIMAGAPPAPATIRQASELGGDVCHVYGLTETYGPHSICEWQKDWDALPQDSTANLRARQGIPYLGFEMNVLSQEGNPVPWDGKTIGEVVMRGHNVVLGYYKDPQRTKESFRGGWFHSADAAIVHPNGYIEIVDRYKDIVITGGEKVSTVEVERVLMEMRGVKAAAVYGTPDEKWGENVTARIELQEGISLGEEEVKAYCRERLAHFKCPKVVEFKQIPWTATGKMQKYLLRRNALLQS